MPYFEIEVPVKNGACTGRNGTHYIKSVEIIVGNALLHFNCISKTKGIRLNAGFNIDIESARAFCNALDELLTSEGL